MPRTFNARLPLFVAVAALVLAAPSLFAQQEPEHSAGAAAGHACACCGNSSGATMNHAGTGNTSGQTGGAATEDHSAHQGATQPAAQAAATPMEHGAGMACCGNMAKAEGPAKADMPAMNHGGGGCAMMNLDAAATPDTKAMDHSAGGCCAGMNHGPAAADAKPMAMGDAAMMSDMQVFHFLLDHRADVRRTVTLLPNGIDTLTESDNAEVAATIKTHVAAMYARLKDGRPIHQRDPLFVELFEHADQIDANITFTEKGLRAVETSTDPAVAALLHKHAATVDAFIRNGMPEMMKNHLE